MYPIATAIDYIQNIYKHTSAPRIAGPFFGHPCFGVELLARPGENPSGPGLEAQDAPELVVDGSFPYLLKNGGSVLGCLSEGSCCHDYEGG